jgi:hypothetical protein
MTLRDHSRVPNRAERAFLDVLPLATRVSASADRGSDFVIGGRTIQVKWVGEGNLGDVRPMLAEAQLPDVVVGRRLSPGARDALAKAGVSWVDETGAAEVALDTIIVSRSGRATPTTPPPARWTPAVLAVAESLLCGTEATVSSTREATGLSTGSCTTALRTLTELGLLQAEAARGRKAGRRANDTRALLMAYATAADALRPPESLQVGVTWRDPVAGLVDVGRKWTIREIGWCATGAAAAAVLAPYLTTIGASEVYVDKDTLAGLEAVATDVGLRPIEGGRLTLRPMPTQGVRRLATEVEGLRVAPWPRVYVDLRAAGVRGEEAAEHLLEVVNVRGT